MPWTSLGGFVFTRSAVLKTVLAALGALDPKLNSGIPLLTWALPHICSANFLTASTDDWIK